MSPERQNGGVCYIHDTVEDTEVSIRDVESRFGKEVAQIVDGVTKLGKVEFRSATEHQVENYRKMLLSMPARPWELEDLTPILLH